MFKMPNPAFVVPYDQLAFEFQNTRPLPLPCMALSPEAKLPTKENDDDFGWDLYPDHVVKVGCDVVPVNTGLAIAIPPGYGAFLKERSGLARKYGVKLEGVRLFYQDDESEDIFEDLSGGVIDAGYRGPLVALLSMREGYPARTFSPADKICQLVILEAPKFVAFWVPELPNSDRGDRGFGDSGGVGSPIKPEPSLGPLGASVSVPESESSLHEVGSKEALLEAIRGINSVPPNMNYYRGDFSLRNFGESPLKRAYKVWVSNGGPDRFPEGLTEETKKRIRGAMIDPPIDISHIAKEYQENLYREALQNIGKVIQGSVTINGVKIPISSAVMYESGYIEATVEKEEEIPTVHTPGASISESKWDESKDAQEPIPEGLLYYRSVNAQLSGEDMRAVNEAALESERKLRAHKVSQWVLDGCPGGRFAP